ncbi:ribonuclease H-like domain-containing protein [Tanacetum coccineum]
MSVHGYTDDEYDVGDNNVTLITKLDVSSPLHLHPNDYATMTVVSVKLKGTENYQVWSCAMLLALEGKNKIDFIDGTCKRSNVDEFLSGLDDTYMQIRSFMTSSETLTDVRSAYATISSEESHRVVASSSSLGTSQRSQSYVFNSNVGYRSNVPRPQTSGTSARPPNMTRPFNSRA